MRIHKAFKTENCILFSVLVLFTIIVCRNAWLGDDSFITFRTIDNFVNGYGLRWNILERVQTYTHPLWLFLLSVFYFFTREIYFTSLFASIILSVCAVGIFACKTASSRIMASIGVIVLFSSKAFIDYSTSGLENPLSYLLAAFFFMVYFTKALNLRIFFYLSLIASLAVLNRMDTILIYFPPLAFCFFRLRSFKALTVLILGFLPFLVWELFSLIYYGFPFPNTAYAKLNTGIPKIELVQRGFYYFSNSLRIDSITLAVIVSAGIFIFNIRKDKEFIKKLAVFCGIFLYLVYVIKIGGCFMSGRFFSIPFFVSVMLIANQNITFPRNHFLVPGAVWLVLMGISQSPPFLRNSSYGLLPKHKDWVSDKHGIADEQLFYFQSTGLINIKKEKKPPYKLTFVNYDFAQDGLDLRQPFPQVLKFPFIGMVGYYAGQNLYIIDPFGLSDALLARLPAIYDSNWRAGHFLRKLPDGYMETIQHNFKKNMIKDPATAKYFEKISTVTRGNIFAPERLKAIYWFNFGKYFTDDYSKLKKHLLRYRLAEQ
ncbi:MAG: hypothetical protein C4541_03950 [Candidatus Auribacter fodinae]|uniref:Glycosyltransferase RgtA/B/C/D-like domain-containing protein n=1 Tax=Candidatus Auribacter fodinae TaxID=2093366 RepID=A0A3A4R7N7_9BACT|nr:MAG: hypothetical protein C4541_03950 [Candidatus Auribacter fodinae]